ncbi:MAG: YceI family protein [Ferruginibacter sp.]
MTENQKEKWVIDQLHSEIDFKIRHLMITNVKGNFGEYDASIYTTGTDFSTAEIDCWINVASINTGNADRDTHLRGADFFDVAQFPQISFIADSYEKVDGDGSFELWGVLTMKGIAKKIKLGVEFGGVVKDPWGNEKAGFAINGKINRKDWGLNYNSTLEAGGVLLGEDITISCEIQLKRGE